MNSEKIPHKSSTRLYREIEYENTVQYSHKQWSQFFEDIRVEACNDVDHDDERKYHCLKLYSQLVENINAQAQKENTELELDFPEEKDLYDGDTFQFHDYRHCGLFYVYRAPKGLFQQIKQLLERLRARNNDMDQDEEVDEEEGEDVKNIQFDLYEAIIIKSEDSDFDISQEIGIITNNAENIDLHFSQDNTHIVSEDNLDLNKQYYKLLSDANTTIEREVILIPSLEEFGYGIPSLFGGTYPNPGHDLLYYCDLDVLNDKMDAGYKPNQPEQLLLDYVQTVKIDGSYYDRIQGTSEGPKNIDSESFPQGNVASFNVDYDNDEIGEISFEDNEHDPDCLIGRMLFMAEVQVLLPLIV